MLRDKHRDELRESGLSDETIAASGIYSADNEEIKTILGWQPKHMQWGSGWVIPFDKGYSRIKLDNPRFRDDKPIKYESPVTLKGDRLSKASWGTTNRAFFPPEFDVEGDTMFITEGEKKALSATQHGFPCIGLVGVWGWQLSRPHDDEGKKYGSRHLIPDLRSFEWDGNKVYICFDSDAAENSLVLMAEHRLAEILTLKGATVKVIRIPPNEDNGDGKVGLDDYLVKHGAEAFQRLVDRAVDPELPPKKGPMDLARDFINQNCRSQDRTLTLRWWSGEFYLWKTNKYILIPEIELIALSLKWLDAIYPNAKPRQALDLVKCLQSICMLRDTVMPPCWIGKGKKPALVTIPAINGIVQIESLSGAMPTIQPHTPHWFSTSCLPYEFDLEAECPVWENEFLPSVLEEDDIELLQRYMGLLLTKETHYQKFLLIIGPPRAGKGVTVRVIGRVMGDENCTSPTLSSLGTDFGLWPLIGATVAMLPDAHLGRNADSMRILECIKSITGEDSQNINRKFLPPLRNVKLPVRFVVTVNELMHFSDTSGSLSARLMPLVFTKSFAAAPDLTLEGRIKPETAGILNWAIHGLVKLKQAGKFNVPEASAQILNDFTALSSPTLTFISECCELEHGQTVESSTLYQAYCGWCAENGRPSTSSSKFGSNLKAANPMIDKIRPRTADGGRTNAYTGIRLTADGLYLIDNGRKKLGLKEGD